MNIVYKYSNRRQAHDVVETLLAMPDGEVEVDVFVTPAPEGTEQGWVWVKVTSKKSEGVVRPLMRRLRGIVADGEPDYRLCTEIYHTRAGAKFFRGYGFIKRAQKEEKNGQVKLARGR